MRTSASPVFTARISEFILHEEQPPRCAALSGLELRLFIPGEPPVREESLPLEHVLQGETTDSYVHFLLHGIEGTGPEQLHRLCLLLMMVREQFYDGMMTLIQTDNR